LSNDPAESRAFRVLVVEDNPHVSEIFRYAFKRIVVERLAKDTDVRVEEANDGHQAWQLLESSVEEGAVFDLVVLDLMLPILDGNEVLARIRRTEGLKSIPVLVITAGDHETVSEAKSNGATAVLRKPVQFKEIREIVGQVL